MKLYIKQKVFSFRDKFTVKAENEDDLYIAEGVLLSLGKQLHVYDMNGNAVAFIKQKLLSWMPRFVIEIGGQEVCEISQKFQFFGHNFNIDGLTWHLDGDFWGHEYRLLNGGETIMRLSKKWFTWGDSYEMDISAAPEQELLCLCIALAVDCALCVRNSGGVSISFSN